MLQHLLKIKMHENFLIMSLQKAVKSAAVDRLTDTTKYTGSHKERFDAEGKGRGAYGRKDLDENAAAGYVSGYKNKDAYDKDKSG